MKIGCLLSVRNKATRFPGKVMLDVAGKALTVRLLERIAMAGELVILATSTHPEDAFLTEVARAEGFASFRGSEDDKLHRYFHAALEFDLDAVVIVDGDDPFVFPEGIEWVSSTLREGHADCVYLSGLPLGAASTGVTTDALRRVLDSKDESDTEVWGGYFIDSGHFVCREIVSPDPLLNHPEIRLTVDYEEDYELVRQVVAAMGDRVDFTSYELMDLLVNRRPELTDLNRSAQEKYEQHIQLAAPVRFKSEHEVSG